MSKRVSGPILLCVLLAGLTMAIPVTEPAAAQGSGSTANLMTISSETEQGSLPTLAVDPSGTVHAFWSSRRADQESDPLVILYAQYRDGAWTDPVDILMSPNGGDALFPRGIVDQAGRLHLIWSGAEAGPFGPLYHSWAPVNDALAVQSWQTPVVLAEGTYQSDVGIDSGGQLHLVYASVNDSRGICHLVSVGDGDYWAEQGCIPRGYYLRDDEHEVRPRMAFDSQDTLHVVWVLDDYSPESKLGYSGRAVYYARSEAEWVTWSESLTIDEIDGRGEYDRQVDDRQPEWSNIIVNQDDGVHIVWVGRPDMQRYHQWSADGGRTWSTRQVAIPSGGYNNWQGLAVDSAGTLHLAWPSQRGMEHTWWNGSQWASPVLLDDRGDPHHGQAAVALGNQLHIVWQEYGSVKPSDPNLIMHALIETNSPRREPEPVPAIGGLADAVPLASGEADVAAVATVGVPSPTATRSLPGGSVLPVSESLSPLVVGLIPALALVVIVLLSRLGLRR